MMFTNVLNEVDQSLLALIGKRSFKAFQYNKQDIDITAIKDFHLTSLKKLASDSLLFSSKYRQGQTHELVWSFRTNPFHTRVFGRSCYNLQPFLALARPASVPSPSDLITGLEPPYLLETRVDIEDALGLETLQRIGFRVVGCSAKFSARKAGIDTCEVASYIRAKSGAWTTRAAGGDDVARLQELIAASHHFSHFFTEPFPGRELGRKLFCEWVGECLAGGRHAFRLIEGLGGEIAGFVSYLRSYALAEIAGGPVGVVDLIAIAPERQGQGIGRRLFALALEDLLQDCNLVELRTALENLPAQRLYARFGLELVSADYMLHNTLPQQGLI